MAEVETASAPALAWRFPTTSSWPSRPAETPRRSNQLVVRWERPIYALAYRVLGQEDDARDVCQEAFPAGVPGHPGLQGAGQVLLVAVPSRIALNLCRDWIRRERARYDGRASRRTAPTGPLDLLVDPNSYAAEDTVVRRELGQSGRTGHGGPAGGATNRHRAQGVSRPDLSARSRIWRSCPLSTVKTRVYQGLAALRGRLERGGIRPGTAFPERRPVPLPAPSPRCATASEPWTPHPPATDVRTWSRTCTEKARRKTARGWRPIWPPARALRHRGRGTALGPPLARDLGAPRGRARLPRRVRSAAARGALVASGRPCARLGLLAAAAAGVVAAVALGAVDVRWEGDGVVIRMGRPSAAGSIAAATPAPPLPGSAEASEAAGAPNAADDALMRRIRSADRAERAPAATGVRDAAAGAGAGVRVAAA